MRPAFITKNLAVPTALLKNSHSARVFSCRNAVHSGTNLQFDYYARHSSMIMG
jgi:hypothetical protein